MATKTRLQMKLFALCVLGVAMMCLPAAASAGKAFYDSISNPLPGNVVSQAFEATQTRQFGDHIRLTVGTSRTLTAVTVTMSSWGCESGGWTAVDCVTTPGATFTHPITLNLYKVDMSTGTPRPGSLIATKTQVFAIPYRPSADQTNCGPDQPTRWYSPADNKCYNGLAALITFDFTGQGITLPDEVIYGIAYNTTHYGYSPIGESEPCYTESGGCGYDSLNVGAENSQSLVGTDVDPNGAFVDSTWAGNYCDQGQGGTGTFRLDTGCWAGYRPQIRFEADSQSKTMQLGDIALSGGFQAGNFPQVWDLTRCALQITATADMTGLVDTLGGDAAHAWSELGIRDLTTTSNFNPNDKGIWLATDYDWAAGTFAPDPNLDLDDKFLLQKKSGEGEGAYNLPSVPAVPGNNHRFWFDRDGVDQYQAQSPLAVDGGTYNTNGIYHMVLNLSSTGANTGAGYLGINGLSQGFEVDGNWDTMELSPAGLTFAGDMTQMQIFYGIYGYGDNVTHKVNFTNISATGCLKTYSVTGLANPAGSGTVTCIVNGIEGPCGAYDWGTVVTVKATPAGNCSSVSAWSETGCSGNTCTITVDADKTITASITPPASSYTLSVKLYGEGSVTADPPDAFTCPTPKCIGTVCTGAYCPETQVKLTPIPDYGYKFSGWSGACNGTGACTVTMTKSKSVTALFTPLPTKKLSVSLLGNGKGTVSADPPDKFACKYSGCSGSYPVGTVVTLTATPDASSDFAGWSGACTSAGMNPTCTATLTKDLAAGAKFSKKVYNLAVTVVGTKGSVTAFPLPIGLSSAKCSTGTCNWPYYASTEVHLTASAPYGYKFIGWSGACSGTRPYCTVTTDSAQAVTATFGPK
jgi:hypothetical protein